MTGSLRELEGPAVLAERMGRPLDPATIATFDPDDLEAIFRQPPALHRFPANMAKRVQAVAAFVVDTYHGDVAMLWEDMSSSDELLVRAALADGVGDRDPSVLRGRGFRR